MDGRKFRISIRLHTRRFNKFALLSTLFSAALLGLAIQSGAVQGQQVDWIWSPRHAADANGAECFYRKKFTLIRPELAEMEIAAGDEYEIYINGQLAGEATSNGASSKHDVTEYLQPGINLIACRVKHYDGAQAGLALKFRVKERGEARWRSLTTNATWKTRIDAVQNWQTTTHNDLGWLQAQSLGAARNVGSTSGAQSISNQATPVAASGNQRILQLKGSVEKDETKQARIQKAKPAPGSNRFSVSDDFTVQQVFTNDDTGSVIAMAFNEFGKILLSREGGPLLIADMSKPQGDPARIQVLCDQVSTCQGILPLNGDVFVTGEGPNGLALYRLTDRDRDGRYEPTQTLLRFTGELGEHGPHGLTLAPDGMIYCMLGNASQLIETPSLTSPFKATYEGDLVPRYEDPGGHAVGVKAPGGTIVRVSVDGGKIETVAGGLRNSYDLVFNSTGEMFVHDSDMESDKGTSWYRETMIFHVPHGAELGWRSGWSKFPQYQPDQAKAACFTGRGSPTGAVLYQHLQFPARFHDTMFFADWSEGRILALKTNESGSSFKGTAEVFLKGRPLNVCDLDVGQDGALYFCTGGRGTEGGVFRVVWNGRIPEKMLDFENDLERVIRHPQPNSAWARQNIAQLKTKIGRNWNEALLGVAGETRNPTKFRMRALDLMVLYGPLPSSKLLKTLSESEDPQLRARVCDMCGLNGNRANTELLTTMMADASGLVRRHACESMLRLGEEPELNVLAPILASTDQSEANVARRLLENIPADQWIDEVCTTDDTRLFIQGAIACSVAQPSLDYSYKILARASKLMEGYVNDRDFVDMIRAMQLAMVQGKVEADKVPAFRERIANEFPSGNGTINRELARLLAYLKEGSAGGRITEYFKSTTKANADKLQVALHLQSVGADLDGEARLAIINELELAQTRPGGGSYKPYLRRAVREVAQTITDDQIQVVLDNGKRWPNAVLSCFYQLPEELDARMIETIQAIDVEAAGQEGESYEQLRLGVIAVLAQNGDPSSMDYLRKLWREEEDRRSDIVIGLAQQPEGENWAYLVSSLPIMDDMTAHEVLDKLQTVNRRPEDAPHYREVIQLAGRLGRQGSSAAIGLLQHWSGQSMINAADSMDADPKTRVGAWVRWYEQKWPKAAAVQIDSGKQIGRYTVAQVLDYIETTPRVNPSHGQMIFNKATCAKCHRVGSMGDSVGPDLTSVAQRFSSREIIEAIVDPNKVISDRYKSKKILTLDGQQVVGMAIKQSDGAYMVLKSDGERLRIESNNIDEIADSDVSCMPTGLLDELQLAEIADLVGFMKLGGQGSGQRQASESSTEDIR